MRRNIIFETLAPVYWLARCSLSAIRPAANQMNIADKATPPLKKNADSVPPSPRALKLQPIHRGSGEVMMDMATVVVRLTAARAMKNDEGICLNLFANSFIIILYHKKSQVFTWDFCDHLSRLLRALLDDLLRHVWWYFLVLR